MRRTTIDAFQIIGIAIRTTNENGRSAKDIQQLWNTFMTKEISQKIPTKMSNDIYSIYTDYESDHTKPYTTILGCMVKNLDTIPEGMVGKSIAGKKYTKFVCEGDLTKGIVYNQWLKIWEMDLQRTYTSDFVIYSESAQNHDDAEIDIFIAVK